MKITIMPEEKTAIVIETQHSEKISTVQRDVAQLGSRFDRHLEIYAQNGKELQGLKVNVGNMGNEIRAIGETLKEMDAKYVTQDQFWPTKTITYGITATMLLGVVAALMSYVVVGKSQSNMSQADINTAAANAATQAVQQVLQDYQSKIKE